MTPLAAHAAAVRGHVVDMCTHPAGGHLGASLSVADILTALYFEVLDPDRDTLVLSKGHAALALYGTLAERGLLPVRELRTYASDGSRLLGHPTTAVPGVLFPTGALGHGLALGAGLALADRMRGTGSRTVVVLGDGELQEGSVWEAASCAAARGLDRLLAVVDRNGLQQAAATEDVGPLEPLAERWEAFGWAVRRIPGHDPDAMAPVLAAAPWQPGRPSVLIADTVKGRGVPFAEQRIAAHYAKLTGRQQDRAHRALAAAEEEAR